ncbi:MAG: MAPEG family protein [Myxococcales bacterium]|nr:MAPEG family protein [Myxococcales bacterium]MCB9748538.1 MAPEG family protein [Myxococcales bacterium]
MLEIAQSTSFQAYAACSAALIFNLLFLAGSTAVARSKAQQMLNPEDQKLNAEGTVVSGDADAGARYVRAHRNALENIPMFLVAGLTYTLVSPPETIAISLLAAFTALRWLHSFAYLRGVQPWRTLSFGLSSLALLGIAAHTTIIVFTT